MTRIDNSPLLSEKWALNSISSCRIPRATTNAWPMSITLPRWRRVTCLVKLRFAPASIPGATSGCNIERAARISHRYSEKCATHRSTAIRSLAALLVERSTWCWQTCTCTLAPFKIRRGKRIGVSTPGVYWRYMHWRSGPKIAVQGKMPGIRISSYSVI